VHCVSFLLGALHDETHSMPAHKRSKPNEEDVPPGKSDMDLHQMLDTVRAEVEELKGAMKKLKRRRKSSGVPQQINPYMFWSNVYQGGERKKVVAENGGTYNRTTNPDGISVSSAAKLLGEKWRGLPVPARDTFRTLRDDYIKEKLAKENEAVAL
jgi:hypothetical protein